MLRYEPKETSFTKDESPRTWRRGNAVGAEPRRYGCYLLSKSDQRLRWFCLAGKQAVFVEKLNHEAIEQPGLLDLASVTGAR